MSQIEASGMEQRAYRRYPASRKAYMVCRGEPVRCRLIDIAQGGARVAAPGLDVGDGDLFLIDPSKRRVHLTRMVWQGDGQMGLQFISSKAFTNTLGGLAGVVQTVDLLSPWRRDEA